MLPTITSTDELAARLAQRTEQLRIDTTSVEAIVSAVREEKDAALRRFTREFDGVDVRSLRVDDSELMRARDRLDTALSEAIRSAADNIRRFHEQQRPENFSLVQPDGTRLEYRWQAYRRTGIYVPAGRYPLPSTLLMGAIPAQIAGCDQIAVVTPPCASGRPDSTILATCNLLGISEVYALGGAQAIAALAFGTESVTPVDMIAGPGNAFVTVAKQLVTNEVGIDLLAGPTELVVIADHTADPVLVAADLISQAEHDYDALPILITTDLSLIERVVSSLTAQLSDLPTAEIARQSLRDSGFTFVANSTESAIAVCNRIAPEHLSLHVSDPAAWRDSVTAGAIFDGRTVPVTWGDYWAGMNHTLPTGGQARITSGLSVLSFLRATTYVSATPATIQASAPDVLRLATSEGLIGHARAVERRLPQ